MIPSLVGITGKKRAGKDSIATFLRGLGFGVDSFAAPIRHVVAEMLGWGPVELERRKEEPLDFLGGVTARHLMQTLGTEWGRSMIHPDLWVICLLRRTERRTQPMVISDVRFDNEASAIRSAGGIVIEVIRPEMQSIDSHASEAGIRRALVDVVIFNDGSLECLGARVREMHAMWLGQATDKETPLGQLQGTARV